MWGLIVSNSLLDEASQIAPQRQIEGHQLGTEVLRQQIQQENCYKLIYCLLYMLICCADCDTMILLCALCWIICHSETPVHPVLLLGILWVRRLACDGQGVDVRCNPEGSGIHNRTSKTFQNVQNNWMILNALWSTWIYMEPNMQNRI